MGIDIIKRSDLKMEVTTKSKRYCVSWYAVWDPGFPKEGREPRGANLLIGIIFAENAWKWKLDWDP